MDVEGRLCLLLYAILYRELEHLQILVSTGVPGTSPSWVLRDNLSIWGIKSYMQIFVQWVGTSYLYIFQESTVIRTC